MDLELTDEQRWLAESVESLLSRNSGVAAWTALLEFGLLEIASGEDGLGAVELALIGHVLGARLEAVPFVDTAAARYAARPFTSSDHSRITDLGGAAAALSLCLLEPAGDWSLERPAAELRDAGGGFTLDAEKAAVHRAGEATNLLVLAADGGERRLVLVNADDPTATIQPSQAFDDSLKPSTVFLRATRVEAEDVLPSDVSEVVLERLLDIGGVLAAAEAVGAAATLVGLACDYAGERRQFGRPIASFQALRHLLADIHVRQTSAWSSVLFAAAALEDEIGGARHTGAIAKAYASRATLEAAHGAIQVFGGVGFTAEHPAHRYLRRILARAAQFGDARHHERAIGRSLALKPNVVQVGA